MKSSYALCLFVIVAAGCSSASGGSAVASDGGVDTNEGGAEADAGQVFEAGGDAPFSLPTAAVSKSDASSVSLDAGAGYVGMCPAQPPKEGDPCSTPVQCSYGASASPACRTWFGCNGAWAKTSDPPASCDAYAAKCAAQDPPHLPACRADAGTNAGCHFDDGTLCECGPRLDGRWGCFTVGGPSDCPPIAPNEGTSCSGASRCSYGFIGGQYACPHDAAEAACVSGHWELALATGCAD